MRGSGEILRDRLSVNQGNPWPFRFGGEERRIRFSNEFIEDLLGFWALANNLWKTGGAGKDRTQVHDHGNGPT